MYKKIIFLTVILSIIAIFAAGCNSQASSSNNTADEPAVNENVDQTQSSEIAAGEEAGTSTDAKKDESDTKAGTIIEPCSLFSKTEAEDLFGIAFNDATVTEQEAVGQIICFYESDDGARFFQISLIQEASMKKEIIAAGQTPEAIFNTMLENTEDPEIIDNIGDKAFIGAPGIHVLADSYYITIALGNSSDPENTQKLKEAAIIAAENLEKLD